MNDQILNGLSDGTYRARWLREVLRTAQITESVKVMLLALGIEEMDPSGLVSVPREELAVRIGRGRARVSERITAAVDQGFLVRVSAGKKGNTAVYAAAVKGSACADPSDTGKGPAIRTESEHFGSDLQDALPDSKGPAIRTETMFGSGLQDALEGNEVRIGGPNDPKKGPAIRDAKVEGFKGEEVELPTDTPEEEFLIGEAAPPAKRKPRAKRAPVPKIPIPPDFAPDEALRAWARENCPLVDIGTQTLAFIEHFTAEPGEKPEMRPGWNRSWKQWMIRQQGWAQERQSNVRQLRPTGTGGHTPYRNPNDQSVYFEDLRP
ncbi:hypothetical protein ETD86_37030 [Nonomuraea turkmeniaca]|uniref:Helix-turn-helix domain-containing protein n=1 Tax=Nonomuraea turkmeniaca TaxID=103838 RepID=A0A5S4F583_9ACTN|nr:hypothetical protein [Nonomuraea turkmeniaca]TMR11052.1 hypothetical protein ETD86_37030 [Nonomuraea turkmeniaca]